MGGATTRRGVNQRLRAEDGGASARGRATARRGGDALNDNAHGLGLSGWRGLGTAAGPGVAGKLAEEKQCVMTARLAAACATAAAGTTCTRRRLIKGGWGKMRGSLGRRGDAEGCAGAA